MLKPFRSIVLRYLSEGRTEPLGQYVEALATDRLDTRVNRARTDPHPGAKVLPIPESMVETVSVVVPYDTAVTHLANAETICIRDCECRVTYGHCDNPLRTCLGLNDLAWELIKRDVAEPISVEEATKYLTIANNHGLVHQAIYTDWLKGKVIDLCSCCTCCCTVLRTYRDYGIRRHIASSGLTARVDEDACTGCGVCVDRCIFDARRLTDERSVVSEANCLGCGLCTTTCPTQATTLIQLSQ